MAQLQDQTIVVPGSVTAGASVALSGFVSKTLFFALSGASLTAQFQFSADDVVWHNVGAALSADGFVPFPEVANFVRVDVTAFTSGTATAVVVGVV